MSLKQNLEEFKKLVTDAKSVLILQPEKPDTDSLSSALALEQILGDQGKEVVIYSRDPLPKYIAYFEGADRVTDVFPRHFDLSILVDTGGPQQIERTLEKHQRQISSKPMAVIDHHANRSSLPIPTLEIIEDRNSTAEIVVDIARELEWPINQTAATLIVPGILADTLNFSIHSTRPEALETVAQMMRLGANIHEIHEAYRAVDALTPELLMLKGRILSRIELHDDGKIALAVITPEELKQYAELRDPAELVIYDMLRLINVQVAATMRCYGGKTNKIKISMRAKMPVAAKTAEVLGGGGHDRAAGCQINHTPVPEAKARFLKILTAKIEEYETLQHSNSQTRNSQTA